MRIALCANGRSPHAVRWANGVVDRGHDVTLVWPTTAFDGADLAGFRPSVSHRAFDLPSVRRKPWSFPLRSPRPSRLARALEPDLVHGFYLSSGGLVAHSFGVHPLVLTALGSDVRALRRSDGGSFSNRLDEAYLVSRTRRAVADADVVLTDSTGLATTICECMPGTDVQLIRFGVELGEQAPCARPNWRRRLEIGDDAFVILSSRLLRPNYNIDTIVRALPAVRREIPGAILALKEMPSFSDGDYRRDILELADSLGVGNAVRHIGELRREELLELYKAADVYISVPSSDGTAVSVLEAMAAGVPVIASDVPGIDPDILHDELTALLVPSRAADSLSEAIVRLGKNVELRRRLAENANDVARRLGDFETELDRAVALYERLAASFKGD
jgi:glycosyltransferase involved in cell wall biosynthesis